MLRKLTLVCLLCVCCVGFTVGTTGCSQGPSEVVVDKSLKDKKLGGDKKLSDHDGAVQVD